MSASLRCASCVLESRRCSTINFSRSAFINKKSPGACAPGLGRQIRGPAWLKLARLRAARFGEAASLRSSGGWWAHQDSNLERAGYEPAALTVELWARSKV